MNGLVRFACAEGVRQLRFLAMTRAGKVFKYSDKGYTKSIQNYLLFRVTAQIEWWPEVELNHRHEDFQSSALPTELSGQ